MSTELKRQIDVSVKGMHKAWNDHAEALRRSDAAQATWQEAATQANVAGAMMQDTAILREAEERANFEFRQWRIADQHRIQAKFNLKNVFRDIAKMQKDRLAAPSMQAFFDARSQGVMSRNHVTDIVRSLEYRNNVADFVGAMIALRALDDVLDNLEKHLPTEDA